MSLYDAVADLPLSIDDWTLERRERDTSSGFTRVTTVVEFTGDGARGRGEDVTYDPAEHDALLAADPDFALAGDWTLAEFAGHLDSIDLFPNREPERRAFRHYRRWGIESAALDLALRQAGTTFPAAFDRSYDPVRFVVSTRLGDPPTADRVHGWLDVDPSLEFKLDATTTWTQALVEELAATDRVRIVDLKGQYERLSEDDEFVGDADPELYRLVRDGLPDAHLEDPALTDETREVLASCPERVTWDSPITDVASIRALPFEPTTLNVKPSRFGSLESLLDAIEYCTDRGIGMYGGGQFELGVGRGQIQAVASTFYPDGPNDVAPRVYNRAEISGGVPSSPLPPPVEPSGFRWTGE